MQLNEDAVRGALDERDPIVGYRACWLDHGDGKHCRRPVGHQSIEIEHELQRQMLDRLGIDWTPGEPFYSLVEAEITRLRRALGGVYLEPCHVTGQHDPSHTGKYVCEIQRSAAFNRVVDGLGFDVDTLPRRTHENCWWCERDPSMAAWAAREG